MNSRRFISNAIYRLKRRYGEPLNIIELLGHSLNLDTGLKTNSYDSVRVNRGIILPSRINKEFVYDLSYIAGNKEFTMGAMFDTVKRNILIDNKDLPTDYKIKNDYYIIAKQVRYEVLEVHEFDQATLAVCKQIVTHPLNNVIELDAYSGLSLEGVGNGTK